MTLGKVWNKIGSRVMVYGSDWDSAQTSVRAMTFAKMVELARDRVKFYVSDLFHDALWLNQEVNGPIKFEWVARESGTHIGDTAKIVKDDDWAGSARYRFEIREDDNHKWVLDTYELVVHEGTPIEDCESAMTGPGCIYHPSPIKNLCTGYYLESGSLQHDGDTCPVHEDLGAKYRDAMQQEIKVSESAADDIINMLFEPNIPTLRNNLTTEPSAPIRKEMKMDEIIRDLREKFSEAESTKEQLEGYQSDISDAVDELDTYMSDLDDLINSLDSLPEVGIYVDLDTVSFDS